MADAEAIKLGDDLMRKASEAFARNKAQKAYKLYGQAIEAYGDADGQALERRVLAWYTRALLATANDAAGDVEEDIRQGMAICAQESFAQSQRFVYLFSIVSARRARLDDDLDLAQTNLNKALESLDKKVCRPFDRYEYEREQLRLSLAKKDSDKALAAGKLALDLSEFPIQRADSYVMIADVQMEREDWSATETALESALSVAFDHKLREQRVDIKDRLAILRRNHPELVKDS